MKNHADSVNSFFIIEQFISHGLAQLYEQYWVYQLLDRYYQMKISHLKVLLMKDWLTLKRNKGFIISFVMVPIVFTALFCWLQSLALDGSRKGSLIVDEQGKPSGNLYYTSNQQVFPLGQLLDPPRPWFTLPDHFQGLSSANATTMANACGKVFRGGGGDFTKIGIVAEDEQIRTYAAEYFNKFFLPQNSLPGNQYSKEERTLKITEQWPPPFNKPPFAGTTVIVNAFNISTYSTIGAMTDEATNQDVQPFCFGVHFVKFDVSKHDYDVRFLFDKQAIPDTNLDAYDPLVKIPDFNSYDMWFSSKSGAAALFPYITEFIARVEAGNSSMGSTTPILDQTVAYAPMSTTEFQDINPLIGAAFGGLFPLIYIVVAFIPYLYFIQKIASEKESKAREGMKMMGLTDSTYYLSWFIVYLVISVVSALLATIVLCSFALTNVSPALFFLFSVMYMMCQYGMGFLVVAFLPTRKGAVVAGVLLFWLSYFICKLVQDPSTGSGLQYALSIFPNVCMNQCVKLIFFYNLNTANGLTLAELANVYQGYSFRGGILMLLLDLVLWISAGLYFDQVIPSQFGVAKPWNFCCVRTKKRTILPTAQHRLLDEEAVDPTKFEPVSDNLKKQEAEDECLMVRGLVKEFGPKKAVNGTDLTMYNGQIFALLGHNGAGKTTTISMLTGLLEPTAGSAKVFGTDIFNNMDEVRKKLGVCPQHDVLFDFLSPEDHLRLFASFKGTPKDQIEGQVDRMLQEIDLQDVRKQLAKTLSGGQKRKLSVAIAMIGDSQIVMLDEPTSGMDTSARRRLWEMLKRNKAGRIVILTTHYMDEADILGDRIAIMAEGKVQCVGSSLFLKNNYGVGYNLVIAKQTRDPAPQVDQFIISRIDNAKKLQEVSSEITYQLPKESSHQFKQFFSDFDAQLDNLGIRSYGVGITTLEEVFLKIGHGDEYAAEKAAQAQLKIQNESVQPSSRQSANHEGDAELDEYNIADSQEQSVFCLHFAALIRKRILMQMRDQKILVVEILFPVLMIILGMYLATIQILKSGQALNLSVADIYPPNPQQFVINTDLWNSTTSTVDANATAVHTFINQNVIAYSTQNFQIQKQISAPLVATTYTNPLSNVTTPALDIVNSFVNFDNTVFNLVNDSSNAGAYGPYHGQICMTQIEGPDPTATPPTATYSALVLVNITSSQVPAAYGTLVHTAMLNAFVRGINPNWPADERVNLSWIDHPFPINKKLQGVQTTISGTNVAFMMSLAWLMISDSLIQTIIRERERNIKHQIMVSGSSVFAYWAGNYVADVVIQSIPAVVGLIFVKVFDIVVPKVWLLFLLIVLANPVFVYALSFLFSKEDAGSFAIKLLYMTFGFVAPFAMSFLQIFPTTEETARVLRWFFMLLPIYDLCHGFMMITQIDLTRIVLKIPLTQSLTSYDWQIAGYDALFLGLALPLNWSIVFAFEFKIFDFLMCRGRGGAEAISDPVARRASAIRDHMAPQDVDEDIIEEANRVKRSDPALMPVRAETLRKKFGNVVAVQNVSFGLEYGECFALLGVSGAGKTTTFKCLTGELYPSHGRLTINGHDVTTSTGFDKARKMIGYCPQFDAIFDGVTVKEHLEIYAALKGIKSNVRARLVDKAIRDMDLTDYTNIRANVLSGGNKRKLSVAIALIGNPPLVFLDEPSTGVDPQAKRFMWNIVSKISTLKKKSAVIITTHSMEEAEALATKMGIMVDGEFRCFGTSQHIKNKFGTGYEMEIKIRLLSEEETTAMIKQLNIAERLDEQGCHQTLRANGFERLSEELSADGAGQEFYKALSMGDKVNAHEFLRWQFIEGKGNAALDHLEGMFSECTVIEHYGASWKLKVSRDQHSIGYLFGMMEDIQSQFAISEYSVAQTTLEQIFNTFASAAEAAKGKMRRNTSVKRKTSLKAQAAMNGMTNPGPSSGITKQ